MPEASEQVTVLIAGKSFGGWEQVSMTRSLDNAAAGFQLSVSELFPGQNQPLEIVPGDACAVRIGDDLVITGYIDTVNPSHDARSHDIKVAGRSKTQDLIDCSVAPPWSSFEKLTILQIADRLAKPYSVDIVDGLKGQTEAIEKFDVNAGETVLSALGKLAALKAVILTDDEQGRLLITRAGTARTTTALRSGEGGNILSGSGNFNATSRYRTYTVVGQGPGSDLNSGQAVSEVTATAEDRGVTRSRTLVIRAEGAADLKKAQDRARWEASSRAGKSSPFTVNVRGWRQGNGELWKINQLVQVKDPLLSVDGEFLISAVTYTLSAQGSVTNLTLTPRAAYELIPEVATSATKGVGVSEFSRSSELDNIQ